MEELLDPAMRRSTVLFSKSKRVSQAISQSNFSSPKKIGYGVDVSLISERNGK